VSQSPSTVAAEMYNESKISKRKKQEGSFLVGMLPLLSLFAIGVILYGVTASGMQGISRYWEIFVALIALFSLGSGWGQAYLGNRSRLWYLIRQIVHWGGLILLLYVLNTQGIRMLMNDHQYTILLAYLLSFAVLLAAVHVDFKLIFFGVFMTYCAFLIAVPTNNPALVALGKQLDIPNATAQPLLMTLGVAGAGLIASLFIRAYMRGAIAAKRSR